MKAISPFTDLGFGNYLEKKTAKKYLLQDVVELISRFLDVR